MDICQKIFLLLALFQVKHFLADYVIQGISPYMMGKFKEGWDFFIPLIHHVIFHGLFTFLILWNFTLNVQLLVGCVFFDMTIHFIMDRLKAGPKYMGRWQSLSKTEYLLASKLSRALPYDAHPDGKWITFNEVLESCDKLHGNFWFWQSLGIDQAVHHLTHYAIIWYVVTHT